MVQVTNLLCGMLRPPGDNRLNRRLLTIATIVLLLLTSQGCGNALAQSAFRSRGEVLKEYETGESNFLVMREGNRVVKYRQWNTRVMLQTITQTEVLAVVDTLLQVCFSGSAGQTAVDCDRLRPDADLSEFIIW